MPRMCAFCSVNASKFFCGSCWEFGCEFCREHAAVHRVIGGGSRAKAALFREAYCLRQPFLLTSRHGLT